MKCIQTTFSKCSMLRAIWTNAPLCNSNYSDKLQQTKSRPKSVTKCKYNNIAQCTKVTNKVKPKISSTQGNLKHTRSDKSLQQQTQWSQSAVQLQRSQWQATNTKCNSENNVLANNKSWSNQHEYHKSHSKKWRLQTQVIKHVSRQYLSTSNQLSNETRNINTATTTMEQQLIWTSVQRQHEQV